MTSVLDDLVAAIGREATIELIENFGGMRLLIPSKLRENHRIVRAVGLAAAQKLTDLYAPDVVRVPLGRELRIQHYRAKGLSHGKIARRLCMTETAVEKACKRMRDRRAEP